MSSSAIPTADHAFGDIYRGEPAGGLLWDLEGISPRHPPTAERFYSRHGRKYLRSGAYEHMERRQKDRPRTWYKTIFRKVEYAETEEGVCDVFTWRTPVGSAVGRRHHNHFVRFPVQTVQDLATWAYVHCDMGFLPDEAWSASRDATGLTRFGVNWSPVQQLLQFDTGIEGLYYLLTDAPTEMESLLAVMQERCMDRLRLGLGLFPRAASIYWGENTSASSISPPYYRRLTLPHVRAYADEVHRHEVRLIVHMCGLLRPLLECFAETGMDGIHSATPPPFGDTPYALLRTMFGPRFTIIGRLNAQLWVERSVEEIQTTLREHIAPDLLDTAFSLMVTTDAMPDIPYESVMTLCDALGTMTW